MPTRWRCCRAASSTRVTLRQIAWGLEKTGTGLYVAPALLDVAGPRTTIRPTAGLTLLHVDHPELSGPRQAIKGLFDRAMAGIALVMLSPVFLALAVAIRASDNGPALFAQTRVGKNGRPFKMYKFRTMVVDAEQRLAELRARNESDGLLFKMRHDPRITAVGVRLRKWSLDELPQLINVVPRRDVAGWTPSAASERGGALLGQRPAPAGGEAGNDRHVAGVRPV